MKKDIQKPFLRAFELGGVVHNCIGVIRWRYDLGYLPQDKPLPDEWEQFYSITLPEQIAKEADVFDDTIIIYTDSSLIDEIEENIKQCKTEAEQERYIFSLLKPFKELSDIFHPKAEIDRLKKAIDECKNDKEMWKSLPENETLANVAGKSAGTPKEQIDACDWFIEKYTKEIERIYYINKRFCKIVGGQINEVGSVERCLGAFMSMKNMFANRLDALLLTYGIDLMRLQKDSGIYLKSHRLITDVDYYIGSRELAQKYIDALPKQETQIDLFQESETNEIKHFNSKETENNLKDMFTKLKNNGYLHSDSDLTAWLYVCTGITDNEQIQPLKWVKDQELLAYLVNVLFGDSDGNRLWVITKQTFLIKGKVPNTDTMKNVISKIKNNWKDKPKKFDELSSLLKV